MIRSTKSKHVYCYEDKDLAKIGPEKKDLEAAGVIYPGWYFWDETEANAHGPFSSEEETIKNFDTYVANL